eukprot:366571-Chlamydomonas_euryale.AAC.22
MPTDVACRAPWRGDASSWWVWTSHTRRPAGPDTPRGRHHHRLPQALSTPAFEGAADTHRRDSPKTLRVPSHCAGPAKSAAIGSR